MFNSYNKNVIAAGKAGFTFEHNDVFNAAHHLNALDWNYFIAQYLDRDLHEKLLEVSVQELEPIMSKIADILTLIRSGYFYTASLLVQRIDVSNSAKLTEIKTWLLASLDEADDTKED